MEDKYYTPSLEEIHVGFEYQFNVGLSGNWKTFVFDENRASDILYNIKNSSQNFRVKYLDAEDIKQENFTASIGDGRLHFSKFIEHRGETTALWLLYAPETKWLLITIGGNTVYAGQCKNKSKLKQILKDINA